MALIKGMSKKAIRLLHKPIIMAVASYFEETRSSNEPGGMTSVADLQDGFAMMVIAFKLPASKSQRATELAMTARDSIAAELDLKLDGSFEMEDV